MASSGHVPSREEARALDAADPLGHMRADFLIPSKAQIRAAKLPQASQTTTADDEESSIYLCGNSLGLQPRLTGIRLQQFLTTWSTQGVFGHFKPLEQSPLPVWLHGDAEAAEKIAPLLGAEVSEVAVMQTLTANLHLLLCAFYRPNINGRHKIILESKAFPSDHYVVESQIQHHALDPEKSMISISPSSSSTATLTTSHILSVIEEHTSTAAVLLLPGIQFYTGQLFNIPAITKAARSAGIFVIWDLAHAIGNVLLDLHAWDVDAAVWCSYKYLNSGPGTIAGLFIHSRHTPPQASPTHLAGWWGSSKTSRFAMENFFAPIYGAQGFQLSNPSMLDITSLNASLEVFAKAGGMLPLRGKSLKLTAYLATLLKQLNADTQAFTILTPLDPAQRGAQLSLKLGEGLLEVVMKELENRGVVVDERRPDVVRVAPAPLYNTFSDVYAFSVAFREALDIAVRAKRGEIDAEGTSELMNTT